MPSWAAGSRTCLKKTQNVTLLLSGDIWPGEGMAALYLGRALLALQPCVCLGAGLVLRQCNEYMPLSCQPEGESAGKTEHGTLRRENVSCCHQVANKLFLRKLQ